ncbi:MAG: hypothetical protein QXS69_00655 [Candidatus Aenigmatarchaeota archaeon]
MKLQFSTNDAIIAVSILIIFFIVLQFSMPKVMFSEDKYIKIISYYILFAIDKTLKINASYINATSENNIRNSISEILLNYLGIIPLYFLDDYGAWKREINVSCFCNENFILTLNNLFKNVNINGRTIRINVFFSNFSDISRYSNGFIIYGCHNLEENFTWILNQLTYNGILFICDINSSYYEAQKGVLKDIFNLTNLTSPQDQTTTLIKPSSGNLASYRAYKILKNQFGFSDNLNLQLLTRDICVAPLSKDEYLFKHQNSDIAAITMRYFGKNIVAWSVDFYRDGELNETEQKILLSLILSVVSYKDPLIDEKFRKNLIPYVTYHYVNFLEPFVLYFSIAS